MNWKKILTAAALTGFSASVATGQGTAPTIVQGDYVSNVFGQSNFVKNPNAKLNNKNVTVTDATATRSTTTPLVATSEYNVTITSANGTAAWATRSFDAGMKNQNCEARFTYRGFQATSKAQIKQGANVVAELVLTPSATDPRIASINFPCGDLSSATTFVITDTATLSGIHEIGGIYVGLATNQANVAQAENVVQAAVSVNQTIPNATSTIIIYNTELKDVYNEYDSTTGIFTAKRAGSYHVFGNTLLNAAAGWATSESHELRLQKNGVTIYTNRQELENNAASSPYLWNSVDGVVDLNVGDTVQIALYQNNGSAINLNSSTVYNRLTIHRFPSASELVVTPETQNVWGGVKYMTTSAVAGQFNLFSGTAEPTATETMSDSGMTSYRTLIGKASAPVSSGCAGGITCTADDFGFSIPNMPVGAYKLNASGLIWASAQTAGVVATCNFSIVETIGNTKITEQVNSETGGLPMNSFSGVYTNTSVATRNFVIRANKSEDNGSTNGGSCRAFIANITSYQTNLYFTIEPLDNNANSALYVQGPVKASATGTAIPSGYVGETKQARLSAGCAGAGVYRDGSSITITPGVWRVTGTFSLDGNTFNDVLAFISPQSGAVTTWRNSFYNDAWTSMPQLTSSSKVSLMTPPVLVRYDGTTMYRFEDNIWKEAFASATGQLWTKYYYSANCIGAYLSIVAERVN